MAILTGQQTGTPGNDVFEGEVKLNNLTKDITAAAVSKATIDAKAGVDVVRGTTTLKADQGATVVLNARGLNFSDITDSGIDNGGFVGTGIAEGFGTLGKATAFGMYNGSINANNGDNTMTFSGTAKSAGAMKGVGVGFATINGSSLIDRMTISGTATGGGPQKSKATAYGTQNTVIKAGGFDRDEISIKATASTGSNGTEAKSTAVGIQGGQVLGEAGDDQVSVEADSKGDGAIARGIAEGQLVGGEGGDTMRVLAKSSASNGYGWGAGLTNKAVFSGGNGGDVMNVSAEASGNASSNGSGKLMGKGRAIGIKDASFLGGDGSDAMFVNATSTGLSGADAFGVANADDISGGKGDDRMIISATTTSQGRAAAYGAFRSTVSGDEGNDQIIVTSKTNTPSGNGGVGAKKSRIVGGVGDDSIKVRGEGRALFDIQDTLIFGGEGEDTLDVGIGSGTVNGGSGTDTIVLDYFNADTMNIAAIDGGVRISGTQDKNGNNRNWRQDIVGVEAFQLGDELYTSNDAIVGRLS